MIAKVLVFCAIFAATHAMGIWNAPVISTGVSKSSRTQDAMGNYAFGYDIVDGKGASNSRAEVGDAVGNKKGSYSLTDIDGRARRVDYVADKLGFRVKVNTNEPGTAMSAPAAAVINSPYAPPVAPVAAAPVLASGPLALGHGGIIGAPMGLMGIGIGAPMGLLGGGIGAPLGILGGGIGKTIMW